MALPSVGLRHTSLYVDEAGTTKPDEAGTVPELLECDSHTQMHVTNAAAVVYNPARYAKSRNSVPRGRPGGHHYAESAG